MKFDWTEDETKTAIKLHKQGRTPGQIARKLGNKSWRSVMAKIRELNRVDRPKRKSGCRYRGTRKAGISKIVVTQQPGKEPVTLPYFRGMAGDVRDLGD